MFKLFQEGGFPMWFLLAFGFSMLFFATRFAWVPVRRTLRTTFALSAATAFTTLTGVCTALATLGHQLPRYLATHRDTSFSDALLLGIAESLSPAILGFTMLSLAALLVALGLQREVTD